MIVGMSFSPQRTLFYFILSLLLVQHYGCKNETNTLKAEASSDQDTSLLTQQISKSPMEKYIKQLDTNYCMGLFEPQQHPDFELIPEQYADRKGLYLRKEVLAAFVQMFDAAQKEGITLQIKSATRNFNYQKGIWERKWTGASLLSDGTNVATDIANPVDKALKILEYSSMPGTSRHHWGTDFDLNAFDNAYFEKGEGKKVYDWLTTHAASYGFCQPYTAKGPDRPNGYNEEKWHWTFQPIGREITNFAAEHLTNDMIKNFQGAETASEIDVLGKYILGINPTCNH